MKRTYLLLLTLALTATASFAQDKLFKEALSQQRPTGCWYRWENTKDKQIKMEKVKAYAQKNNLLLGKITNKEVGRFGDIATSVHTVEFLPPEEMQAYIIENILDKTISAAYMKSKGAVLVTDNPSKQQYFKWVNDALWSGNVVDGRIDGNGKGGKQIDATHYIAFEGSFRKGIPQGSVKFYSYQASSQYEYYNGNKRSNKNEKFGTMNDGMTWFIYHSRYDGYGFIDENGRVVVPPIYQTATDYSNGTALVVINNVRFDIDKQGIITGLSEGQRYVTIKQLADINKYYPEALTATQSAAKKLITKSDVDDLLKIATEFSTLRDDVEKELKNDIPSYTFADLAKVDNAFNNLKDLTLKCRTEIYNADCAKLVSAYDKAVASSKQHQNNTADRDFVNQFVLNYESTYKFDPDQKVAIAKQIQDYYDICNAVSFQPSNSYTCLTCNPPVFYGADSDFDMLIAAWEKASEANADFKDYADYAKPIIQSNGNKLYSIIDNEISAYRNAINAEIRNVNSFKKYKDLEPHIVRVVDYDNRTGAIYYSFSYGSDDFAISEHYCDICATDKRYSYYLSRELFSQKGTLEGWSSTRRGEQLVKIFKDEVIKYLDEKYKKNNNRSLPWK